MSFTRRTFLAGSALGTASPIEPLQDAAAPPDLPDLTAQWIWFPERRTLPSTFVLFRREYDLAAVPKEGVAAWVTGQSRYELLVNGKLVSRGPAPCDPRYWEVDPVDLGPYLQTGKNVVCGIVCCYGGGDGTWVPPSPMGSGDYGQGFLFEVPALGWKTDNSWQTLRTKAWKTGNFQRWYLRALQEEFDMRQWPDGWFAPGFKASGWKAARVARTQPGLPNLTERPRGGGSLEWKLQARPLPLLREGRVRAEKLVDAGWIDWSISPEEYFECFPDDAFTETRDRAVARGASFPYTIAAPGRRSVAVTFDLGRELVGYPYVHLRASAGTVVEILFVENQEPGKLLLRTHPRFGQWVRLTAKEGLNTFEAFEYDAVRLLQFVIRNARRPVVIEDAGVNAKSYAWPHECDLKISDAAVQRACDASLNTHHLTSIETMVDNQVRERQQYSGDLEHPKLASYYAHGEYRQAARMFRTFTQGQSREGWFMDCWPAWDRCQRLYQKHLGLTEWGPILDHALQLGLALEQHHLFTADDALLAEIYPKLRLFDEFLHKNLQSDGMLPVEPWTWNSVWIDHVDFRSEQDKHCAFNLYYAGFLQSMGRMGTRLRRRTDAADRASRLIERVRAQYWSPAQRLFIDNLPRASRDGEQRLHARTLSMALLFGTVPPPDRAMTANRLDAMRGVGMNYPLNEIWRLWALASAGRGDVIVRELRQRWATAPSVLQNNTYAEFWDPKPSSSGNVWCQSNPVPLIAAYQLLLGLRPVVPGFAEYEVRPQPADLASIEATVHTVRGPIRLRAEGRVRGFGLSWRAPGGAAGSLVVPENARVTGLPSGVRFEPGREPGTQRVALPMSKQEQEWNFGVQWA